MISENKLKHSLGVARQCELLAMEKQMSEEEQKACFVMGFLHDIGYENAGDITQHPKESFNYVNAFNMYSDLCSNAIKHHGNVPESCSTFDIILNTADMTVDYQGDIVSVEKRLEGIKQRYSEDSSHYKHAIETAIRYGLIKEV